MAANGIRVEVDQSSMNRVLNNLRKKGASVDPNVRRIIAETGLRVQADAKRDVRVLYGFLRSSIYFDYAGRVKKQVSLTGNAPAQTRLMFPSASETHGDGLNFVVGSQMRYAEKIEELETYLLTNFDRRKDDAEKALDKLLKALVK